MKRKKCKTHKQRKKSYKKAWDSVVCWLMSSPIGDGVLHSESVAKLGQGDWCIHPRQQVEGGGGRWVEFSHQGPTISLETEQQIEVIATRHPHHHVSQLPPHLPHCYTYVLNTGFYLIFIKWQFIATFALYKDNRGISVQVTEKIGPVHQLLEKRWECNQYTDIVFYEFFEKCMIWLLHNDHWATGKEFKTY